MRNCVSNKASRYVVILFLGDSKCAPGSYCHSFARSRWTCPLRADLLFSPPFAARNCSVLAFALARSGFSRLFSSTGEFSSNQGAPSSCAGHQSPRIRTGHHWAKNLAYLDRDAESLKRIGVSYCLHQVSTILTIGL